MSRQSDEQIALRALAALDLTNLDAACTPSDIDALCAKAVTPYGHVAAICIWPRFVAQAERILPESPVRIATVVNFPGGDDAPEDVEALTRKVLAEGADEVDLVIPYRALMEGDEEAVTAMVRRLRAIGGHFTLKTILETGALNSAALIARASRLCIAAGADFLKTSTGKIAISATPDAARAMLEEIAADGASTGFKAAGGVRSLADARLYLELADTICGPDWAGPATFRFGASGLLDALLAELDGRAAPQPERTY